MTSTLIDTAITRPAPAVEARPASAGWPAIPFRRLLRVEEAGRGRNPALDSWDGGVCGLRRGEPGEGGRERGPRS